MSQCFWIFGDFVVDEGRHLLLHQGVPRSVTSKQLETLIFLIRNPGRLLTKQELLAGIWPDSFVEESNLSQNIFWLRKALNDGHGNDARSQYIVTVPGKGYRFVGEVRQHRGDDRKTQRVPAENDPGSVALVGGSYPTAHAGRNRLLLLVSALETGVDGRLHVQQMQVLTRAQQARRQKKTKAGRRDSLRHQHSQARP